MPIWRLILLRLAKDGFGSLEELSRTRVDLVLDAYEFTCFQSDYQRAYEAARSKEKN